MIRYAHQKCWSSKGLLFKKPGRPGRPCRPGRLGRLGRPGRPGRPGRSGKPGRPGRLAGPRMHGMLLGNKQALTLSGPGFLDYV